MSTPQRQSNLFAAEDFIKVFRSFKQVNFTAYDFDNIRSALVDYIKEQYPEDFNDFIDSSEFIAIIELLSFLGTSLAFRTELNSRENFLDTAERRDSIIRLARMLSYNPSRNIPGRGLMKVVAVQTNEPVQDSMGRSLQDQLVFWNDANNPDSFEQFVSIVNAALVSTNTFGRPNKSGIVGNVPTDLYQMNNSGLSSVTYNTSLELPDGRLPVDIVNPDFDSTQTVFERLPDTANAFHLLYRNDSNGLASKDTGFFVHFRQGALENRDFNLELPVENRVLSVDFTNINNTDVYVQEIDDQGNVIDQWTKVPALAGSNIVFNDLNLSERKIYSVITEDNDRIKIKFADGNFGSIPKGIFRVWFRRSANQFVTIRPENASNIKVSIPYAGKNGRTYFLTLSVSLETTVANAAPSESDEDIKLRAPQVFYTQNRMVNSEDYNVFPLTKGNEIEKLRAINRTHSGHSRFIDINDPTGTAQNLIVFGEDGYIYKETDNQLLEVEITTSTNLLDVVRVQLQQFVENTQLNTWFYEEYISEFQRLFGESTDFTAENIRWKNLPQTVSSNTGFFLTSAADTSQPPASLFTSALNLSVGDYSYIEPGAYLTFVNPANGLETATAAVMSVSTNGLPTSADLTSTGPVALSREINEFWKLNKVLPSFNKFFDIVEVNNIVAQLENRSDFGIGYDAEESLWYIIPPANLDVDGEFDLSTRGTPQDSSWIIRVDYQAPSGTGALPKYVFITRGSRYVFGSDKEVRFFYSPEQRAIDVQTGLSLKDSIDILANNTKTDDELWEYNTSSDSWNYLTLSIPANERFIQLRTRDSTLDNLQIIHGNTVQDLIYGPTFIEVSYGRIVFDSLYTPSVGDYVQIIYSEETSLGRDVRFSLNKSFILADGHLDQTKVQVVPVDSDEDGVPDYPLSFDEIVSARFDLIFFEQYTDFDGYQYFRPWRTGINLRPLEEPVFVDALSVAINGVRLNSTGLIALTTSAELDSMISQVEDITVPEQQTAFALALSGKIVFVADSETFYVAPVIIAAGDLLPGQNNRDAFVETTAYQVRRGRTFNSNTLEDENPLWFKWKHFAPRDNRLDPSVSNLIDMFVLTSAYWQQVQLWKEENRTIGTFPVSPTTQDLTIQFGDLNQYKMISDEIIFKPAKFKVLFGNQAEPQLRARFKVVKIPTVTVSDNEIRSRIIAAIEEYFDIKNWDFGESFYYTELSAYIHQQLASVIATVVIVPEDEASQFGDLFQIKAEPDELFISTATVLNIDVVTSLTNTNLRTK